MQALDLVSLVHVFVGPGVPTRQTSFAESFFFSVCNMCHGICLLGDSGLKDQVMYVVQSDVILLQFGCAGKGVEWG